MDGFVSSTFLNLISELSKKAGAVMPVVATVATPVDAAYKIKLPPLKLPTLALYPVVGYKANVAPLDAPEALISTLGSVA